MATATKKYIPPRELWVHFDLGQNASVSVKCVGVRSAKQEIARLKSDGFVPRVLPYK